MEAPVMTPRSSSWLFGASVGLAALSLFAGLAYWMRTQQDRIIAQSAFVPSPAATRPPAEITAALRTMKLVTVEIDTTVRVERGDTSWRGDVSAAVQVPVRLSYGTDLSALKAEAAGFSPLAPGGRYIVRVPRPTRLATEIFSEKERAEVEAGWLRLRSRAGEYYLGLARRDAAPAARDLVLRPDDQAKVDQTTREQVAAMVRSIVGNVDVRVIFEDPE